MFINFMAGVTLNLMLGFNVLPAHSPIAFDYEFFMTLFFYDLGLVNLKPRIRTILVSTLAASAYESESSSTGTTVEDVLIQNPLSSI